MYRAGRKEEALSLKGKNMPDTSDHLEIARRLRREHKLLQQIAAGLEEVAQSAPGENVQEWLLELKKRFEHFRAHMFQRIALEEVGGFMKAVEDMRPTLSPQIELLKTEHQKMLGMIEEVHKTLERANAQDLTLLEDCTLRIRMVLSEVREHEKRENMLVGFVFNQDIGFLD